MATNRCKVSFGRFYPGAGKSVLVFLGLSAACMLWIGEPGRLVGPWAMPAERPGDRLGRLRDDLRSDGS
jgi:hypothetical protein